MRYFVLLDLRTQAEMLPPEMQTWPQERFLSWLGLFGEVLPWPLPRLSATAAMQHDVPDRVVMTWLFRAPTKLETRFVISKRGQFAILTPFVHQIWGDDISTLYELDTGSDCRFPRSYVFTVLQSCRAILAHTRLALS